MSFAAGSPHPEGLLHHALNGMQVPTLATVGKSLGLGVGLVCSSWLGGSP